MFYMEEIQKIYKAIKSDNNIEETDRQKVTELLNQIANILALY